MSALTDLEEWTRGVLFPLVVIGVAACAGYSVRCLTHILREFQETRREVLDARRELRRIARALEARGILTDEEQ